MTEDTKTPASPIADPAAAWQLALDAWGQVLAPLAQAGRNSVDPKDKRFSAPEWEHPVFDLMRQGYSTMAKSMFDAVQRLN